jgi:hypothetical protein
MAQEQFDKLAGVDPAGRTRGDRLPTSLVTTLEKWLDDSGADDLANGAMHILLTQEVQNRESVFPS